MSFLLGTLNNTLASIRENVSRAYFYIWTDGAPRIIVEQNGNSIVGGTLVNNKLNLSRTVTEISSQNNLITDALTMNQTLYGPVENSNNLSWVINTTFQDYSNVGTTPTSRKELTNGNVAIVMHIRIVPTSQLDNFNSNILFETLVFGEFTTSDSNLESITFLPSTPTYPLNLYSGTPFSVDRNPTFYANFSPTLPFYNNHGFLFSTRNTITDINNAINWSQNPNSVPASINCVPTCPNSLTCDTSIGLCRDNGRVPDPIIPPNPDPVQESWWRWWMWLIVAVVIIIIIIIVFIAFGSKQKVTELVEESENDENIDEPLLFTDDLYSLSDDNFLSL